MSKTIIVRESYDWITENEVTPAQLNELVRYMEEKYPNEFVLDMRYKRVRFINYVGIIQCSDVRYEILPKISLSLNDDRKALLSMLSITGFLPISFYETVHNGEENSELLTTFLRAFLARLLGELKKGPYKTYERQEENLFVLKGKLEVGHHIRTNPFLKTRAYCSFDEHTENNSLNQLFKTALVIVKQHTGNHSLTLSLERCLNYLENVDLLKISTKINQFSLNRQNERFREAALFAKLIIEKASIYSQGQRASSFSFLFPINTLFEKYIGVALQAAAGDREVISQHAEKRLLRNKKSGYGNILLKPDFVVNQNLIIDTKWKSATVQGRSHYQQADIYQMYAYVTAYDTVDRCILLYPKQEGEVEHPVWEVVDSNKTIEMNTVRIDEFETTVEELKVILAQLNS
ncbi:ATP-dependent helicase [Neobacillus sp. MM2021_6]|uniref:McrC family protein n=1 Tax=Bacillaceae TaxID=186817 RepID=UPI00140BBF65|nr:MULTISPECIES: ATP-dependent helicase [Bacillaceae]MBO0962842.1 ATP-dependent helicase [Neobacillus sp. MM2021_6]NHC21449.1 ATP-dependent helicase [Bacillus sp. MM2020_4]